MTTNYTTKSTLICSIQPWNQIKLHRPRKWLTTQTFCRNDSWTTHHLCSVFGMISEQWKLWTTRWQQCGTRETIGSSRSVRQIYAFPCNTGACEGRACDCDYDCGGSTIKKDDEELSPATCTTPINSFRHRQRAQGLAIGPKRCKSSLHSQRALQVMIQVTVWE